MRWRASLPQQFKIGAIPNYAVGILPSKNMYSTYYVDYPIGLGAVFLYVFFSMQIFDPMMCDGRLARAGLWHFDHDEVPYSALHWMACHAPTPGSK